MVDAAYCRVMAQYNSWMNEKLYGLSASIPDSERKRDRGAFFKSVHGTLNHLLSADLAWMTRFTGEGPELPGLGAEMYESFDDLSRERRIVDVRIVEWATTLSHEWLEQPLTYTSSVDDVTRTIPTWAGVVHMFNHGTHHRGQLTTLLKQMGLDPGITDLPWLPGLAR